MTIQTDPQVFRWFLYLISRANVRKEIELKWPDQSYSGFILLLWLFRLISFLCLLLVIFVIASQQFVYLIYGAPLAIMYLISEFFLKKKLTGLSMKVIAGHFSEEQFKQKTLFQICETLARHFGVVSLIEGVTLVDMTLRKILIYSAFFVVCIQLLSFWKGLLTLVLFYFAGFLVVNINWIYKSLMK